MYLHNYIICYCLLEWKERKAKQSNTYFILPNKYMYVEVTHSNGNEERKELFKYLLHIIDSLV